MTTDLDTVLRQQDFYRTDQLPLLVITKSIRDSIRQSRSAPVKLRRDRGFPLVLITTNACTVFRKADRLKLRRALFTDTRIEASYGLIGIWCNKVRNGKAFTGHNSMRLGRGGGGGRKGDAVTCGWEHVCIMLMFMIFFQSGKRNVPLLNLWSMSPVLRAKALGTGVAGMNEPGWFGSSNSSPPQSSWKSIVSVLS